MLSRIWYSLEMRKYSLFERLVDSFLKESSWNDFLDTLERIQSAPNWDLHTSEGKIRDGIIELLQLQEMRGLDIDVLEAFRNIKGINLEEIREGVREHSISLLREQIRIGNTFFIDTDDLKETELTVLIPGILEARLNEVQNLETKPPLSDVYSTYYGFSILTSGGLAADWGGVPPETKSQLLEVMQQIGNVENISAKQLKFSYLSFSNCSDNLKTILWNLLKMCIGGIKSQKAGIEVLGNIADTRVIDLMNSKLENVKDSKVKEILLESIGRIGSPRSYEAVISQLDNGRNLHAVKALGSIRDARITEVLKELSNQYYWRDQQSYFEALGNTRNPAFIPYLKQQQARRNRSQSSELNTTLLRLEAMQKYENI